MYLLLKYKKIEIVLILSKQILITNQSSSEIINSYLTFKIEQAFKALDIKFNENNTKYQIVLKYKKIEIIF